MSILLQSSPSLGTIQLTLSTDGNVSFAAFTYTDPELVISVLSRSSAILTVGFDGGLRELASANFGESVLERGKLNAVNIFRIDGMSYSLT